MTQLETDESCSNCVNHVVWEKYEDYNEDCFCVGEESQESHFANCFIFVGELVHDKCQYWEGQVDKMGVGLLEYILNLLSERTF